MSKSRYEIEGNLKSMVELDFATAELEVLAFMRGEDVGHGAVDERGHYQITFESDEAPAATELRILPARLAERGAQIPALAKTFSPHRYLAKNHGETGYHASLDLPISRDYQAVMSKITRSYRIYGSVFATPARPSPSLTPLAGVRIDFFEIDPPTDPLIGLPRSEDHLGSAMAGPDGSYDFKFDFTFRTPYLPDSGTDVKPDILARIFQFVDGVWRRVHDSRVEWDIEERFHRNFYVPEEYTFPVPDPGVAPATGLRFTSLGLLPIDAAHVVGGYADGQLGDPANVEDIRHQPFCGTLRVFGLFAPNPAVASYQVEVADADANGVVGRWRNVTDALHNLRWNVAESRWEAVVLGPDPANGRYLNVDTYPEGQWLEHALKLTWNSANLPDGFYALRITGYDAADNKLTTTEMPILRIDNHPPEASLGVVGTGVCGGLTLAADRKVQFKVTAHDPAGHVLRYTLSGTRGRDPNVAFPALTMTRGSLDLWAGADAQSHEIAMDALPPELATCAGKALAYNVELDVQGLSTDGYHVTPSSQRVRHEVNLVVNEP